MQLSNIVIKDKTSVFNKLYLILLPWIWIWVGAIYKNTTFQTNDDPAFVLTASGWWIGEVSDQLIFISRSIGFILSKLYSIDSSIPWYALMLNITQAVAISQVSILILNINKNIKNHQIITNISICLTAIGMIFFISIQFTQTAIISSGIGTILIILSEKNRKFYLGIILTLIGLMLRFEGGVLGIFLAIILLIPALKENYNFRKSITKIIIIATVIATVYIINLLTWSSWTPWLSGDVIEFIKFNNARGTLDGGGGYSESKLAENVAIKNGLSLNDWLLFKSWYFADPKVYTAARLSEIASYKDAEYLSAKVSFQSLINFLEKISSFFIIIILYVIVLVNFYGKLKWKKQEKIIEMSGKIDLMHMKIIIVNIITVISILYFVYAIGRLPSRILWPVLYVSSYVNLIVLILLGNRKKNFNF